MGVNTEKSTHRKQCNDPHTADAVGISKAGRTCAAVEADGIGIGTLVAGVVTRLAEAQLRIWTNKRKVTIDKSLSVAITLLQHT